MVADSDLILSQMFLLLGGTDQVLTFVQHKDTSLDSGRLQSHRRRRLFGPAGPTTQWGTLTRRGGSRSLVRSEKSKFEPSNHPENFINDFKQVKKL